MNCRFILYFALLLHFVWGRNAIGDEYTPKTLCVSCERMQPVSIVEELTSKADGSKRKICRDCSRQPLKCFACNLPAVKNNTTIEDGRFYCSGDFANMEFDPREAERIAFEVTRELTPLFYRFDMKFPANNVTVSIVDARKLHALARQRYDPRNCGLRGLNMTTSSNGGLRHQIYLLSGLPRKRLCAIYAHEVGHAWMNENLPRERISRLHRDTIEGFCELIAYQFMDSRSEEFEKLVIKENLYTSGQQNMLVETDTWYGFHKILTWFREGKVSYLDQPDTVRTTVAEKRAIELKPRRPRIIHESPSSAPALPTSIIVKGISGTPARRIALINNVNLMEGEAATVRLAHTNAHVQCLKIEEFSVKVSIDGTEQMLYLRASSAPPPKKIFVLQEVWGKKAE